MLDLPIFCHTRLGRGYGASIRGKVQNRATDLGWVALPSVLRWFKGARVLTPIRFTHTLQAATARLVRARVVDAAGCPMCAPATSRP
jgi:hypothetical protein